MIDINCQILHGFDNGAKHSEESIAIAREAVKQGVDTIIATPTHTSGDFHRFKLETVNQVNIINQRLSEENIPLTVLPGQIAPIDEELLTNINENVLFINEISSYLLLELPPNDIPHYTRQLIFDMQIQGYKPIIVHPERNQQMMSEPNQLYELVRQGALVQLSAQSITGEHGKKVYKLAHEFMENNLAHFIGSEANNQDDYLLEQALKVIKKKFDKSTVSFFVENPFLLINGETVLANEPVHITKKKILGIL
ncbi:tyrosine-protein phosphatase [Aquibacillus rhizosphaerae]|uniref:Tyrosine-protein phosphatase n=1 Tax=Aquibacillus rhizosphaerae TaxID=3051431 RepID=A0ABT7KZQ6_9BACI|nr:CpsB/CapC family capsule biosynthesis tyrosine phosphatase [Aquibacillus sp. LR5S19]MDL4838949.1 tyrosine protein phosphatase [Aquibacillus sp. LR5S19]